jgi:hypothetical protein
VAGQRDRPSVAETAGDDLARRLERLPPGHPSSPYDGDGTRKPPVARPTDRELPLPDGHGTGPESAHAESAHAESAHAESADGGGHDRKPSGTQDLTHQEPASAGPAGREAAGREPTGQETLRPGSQSWQEALPHLKEQWDHHQERWPEEQHAQIDRSNDEPGCWRGDSGRRLSARDNVCADAGCDRIAKAEAQITTRIEGIERASAGELAGKDFRLKGRDRLKDKIAAAREGAPGADFDQLSANIHDAVRYTLRYEYANYTEGVKSDVGRLKEQGFDLIKLRNFWNDAEYKGINSQWNDRQTGQTFEVQFHTCESFEAKQVTHKAYERLRNPQITEDQVGDLHNYQRDVSSKIPMPIGAPDIPEYL